MCPSYRGLNAHRPAGRRRPAPFDACRSHGEAGSRADVSGASRSLPTRVLRRFPPLLRTTLLGAAILVGCGGGDPQHDRPRTAVTVRGSDTMVILAQHWAEGLRHVRPDIAIQVTGGGTGTGIAALMNGTADLATASRPMTREEQAQLAARRGGKVHEWEVAVDAVAVYVREDNPVTALSLPDLANIYRGQLASWRDVGGADRPFVLYSRENSSGTYAYFKEHVLRGLDFAAEAQSLPGTAAIIHAVRRDAGGIGFGGIGFGAGVRALAIGTDTRAPVPPTLETAMDGRYPLARYLYLYAVGEPSDAVRQFVAFARSPVGQRAVERVGYFPLPSPSQHAALEGG